MNLMHHYCCFQDFILLLWRIYLSSQVKTNKSNVQKSKTTQSSKPKSGRCHYLSKTTLGKKQKCLYAQVSWIVPESNRKDNFKYNDV
jgi:hypothetical protein